MIPEIYARILALARAIIKGHYVLNSGKHTCTYVDKWQLYKHSDYLVPFCRDIIDHFTNVEPLLAKIDVIVGPAVGGIPLCTLLQLLMTEQKKLVCKKAGIKYKPIYAAFAIKDFASGELKIQDGYRNLIRGKNVLVIDDVVSSGKSLTEVIHEVLRLKGNIVGAACMYNRGVQSAKSLSVPTLYACIDDMIFDYPAEACPLCQEGVPISTSLGHGAEYVKPKKARKMRQRKPKPFDKSIF